MLFLCSLPIINITVCIHVYGEILPVIKVCNLSQTGLCKVFNFGDELTIEIISQYPKIFFDSTYDSQIANIAKFPGYNNIVVSLAASGYFNIFLYL